jgi:chemotaxis protein MotA
MFAIIGLSVVLGSVMGGYLMEHGNISVLLQPAELLIIFGAALGSLILSSPKKVLKLVVRDLMKIFKSTEPGKEAYLEVLLLMNALFWRIRKDGLLAIEGDIEDPSKSETFSRFKTVASNHHALHFICDNFRVILSTNMPAHEFDTLLEIDIGSHHHEEMLSPHSIAKVGDALPGLGIVAAVLGIVLTMGKITEPPAVLGHSIGAALVGTFLGVLACYGFVGPIATNLEHKAKENETYFNVIKTALVAFVGGAAPQVAVEAGRRAVPPDERPSFAELEEAIKQWKDKPQ